MNQYTTGKQIIAGILFVSHGLVSCSGFINADQQSFKEEAVAPSPQGLYTSPDLSTSQEDELTLATSYHLEGTAPLATIQTPWSSAQGHQGLISRELVGKTFEPQVGQEVTFYQEGGVLKGKTWTHSGLDVYIGEVNLAQKLRARHIHIVSREQAKNKKGYVYIDQGGLLGGMMENGEDDNNNRPFEVPRACFCPITQKMMEDPVMARDGYTYERSAILKWFSMGKVTSPKTGARLAGREVVPNDSIRSLVASFKAAQPRLVKHQGAEVSLEATIELRDKLLQETLILKMKLLQQEQDRIAEQARISQLLGIAQQSGSLSSLTPTAQLFNPARLGSSPASIHQDLRALIWKISEREIPFEDVLMVEGELEEKDSRSALIALEQALLEELNSQLPVKQPHLVAAIKEASSKAILDKSSRIIYERISQAAADAKGKTSHVSGKEEIASSPPVASPSSIVVKDEKEKEVPNNRLKELLAGPIEKTSKLDPKGEAELIQKWFESKETYDSIILHESQALREKHLTSFNFQSKGHLLNALDLRGAKQLKEGSFMALHTYCPNLVYLNISGWPIERLGYFNPSGLLGGGLELHQEPIFPSLQRLIIEGCKELKEIDLTLASLESLEAKDNQSLKKLRLSIPHANYIDISGHQASLKEQATWFKNIQFNSLPTIKGLSIKEKAIQQTLAPSGDKLDLSHKSFNSLDIVYLVNHPLFKEKKGGYKGINLSNNQMGAIGLAELAKNLQGTSVQTVDLQSNQIGDKGASEFAKNLQGTSVETVDLSWNNIGEKGAAALAKNLQGTKVEKVNLSGNQIGDLGATAFAKSLQGHLLSELDLSGSKQLKEGSFMALHTYCPNLVYLNISGWPLERVGYFKPSGLLGGLELHQGPIFDRLQRLIIEGCKKLKKIDLSLASLESLEAKDNQALKQLRLNVPAIKYIDITGHQASLEEQATWSENLQFNSIPTIKGLTIQEKVIQKALAESGDKLDLMKKSFNDVAIISLVTHPLFKEKKGVYQEINLSYNQIGDKGASEFAKNLQGTSVQEVDLSFNQIGSKGAAEFAKNLQGTSVKTVDLSRNQIGDKGAAEFAKNLQGTSVQKVKLLNNQIGAQGAAEFAKNLQGTSVQTVYLGRNQIGDEMQASLKKEYPNIMWIF